MVLPDISFRLYASRSSIQDKIAGGRACPLFRKGVRNLLLVAFFVPAQELLLIQSIGQPGAIHKRGKLAHTSHGAGNFTIVQYNDTYSGPNSYCITIQVFFHPQHVL